MHTAPTQGGWAAFVASLISFHVKERFLSQVINVNKTEQAEEDKTNEFAKSELFVNETYHGCLLYTSDAADE